MLQKAEWAIEEKVTKQHVVYQTDNFSSMLGKYNPLIKQDKLVVVNPAPLAGLLAITCLTIPSSFSLFPPVIWWLTKATEFFPQPAALSEKTL